MSWRLRAIRVRYITGYPLFRRPRQQDHHGQARCRGRSRPHRNPYGHGQHRHKVVATRSSMARPNRHRQGGPHSRDHNKNHHRDRLLPAQFSLVARTRCNEVVRSHWGVENRLHWRLDVTMNEDQDRTRLDNSPHNLAVLRHMALNVMQKDTTKGSLRGKFMRAGWDDRYLARLLALF